MIKFINFSSQIDKVSQFFLSPYSYAKVLNRIILTSAIVFLSSCNTKSSNELELQILSPKNTFWGKHEGLPKFNSSLHSDGCSGGMSLLYKKLTFLHSEQGNRLKWRHCCEVHDKAYYYGGSNKLKKEADTKLNQCVTEVVGNQFLGSTMELAVKIGGGPYLPTPYRWGYGEDFRED